MKSTLYLVVLSMKIYMYKGKYSSNWKAENITEDTALLQFLVNSKPRCIAKFVSSAFTIRGVLTAV